jgi:hypothetical protein
MLPWLLPALMAVQPVGPDARLSSALAQKHLVRRADHALPELQGDFDGDGKTDRAIAVALARGKDRGVLVLWGSGKAPVLLGAASDFNRFRDHDFDLWEVRRAKAPSRRDAMVWIWSEKASARIVWTGRTFRWIQEGD